MLHTLQIKHIITPLQFVPNLAFEERKHLVDQVAMEYLKKVSNDVSHLVAAIVVADGNCLYNSILLLMNNFTITTSELRGIETLLASLLLSNVSLS